MIVTLVTVELWSLSCIVMGQVHTAAAARRRFRPDTGLERNAISVRTAGWRKGEVGEKQKLETAKANDKNDNREAHDRKLPPGPCRGIPSANSRCKQHLTLNA
eukprot:1720847-Pleurochrysis_carterae.AAC.1